LVTERELPSVYVKNLAFLHPSTNLTESLELLISATPALEEYLSSYPATKLPEVAMLIDQAFSLDAGVSLARLRTLCALRIFEFDLNIPWESLCARDISFSQRISSIEYLRYSYADNQ